MSRSMRNGSVELVIPMVGGGTTRLLSAPSITYPIGGPLTTQDRSIYISPMLVGDIVPLVSSQVSWIRLGLVTAFDTEVSVLE